MKSKVYCVLNDYSEDACKLLETAGFEVCLSNKSTRPDETELIDLVQKYDVLIIGAREKMTEKVYHACTRTKIIGTLSVGLDHISDLFLSSSNITVLNCPTSNVISVAEHTIALILALKKRLVESNEHSLDGSGRKGMSGLTRDISCLTLGVIGAGRIATEVIRIANAFKLKILCFTRNPNAHENLLPFGVDYVTLDTLLSKSDIITIHLPLVADTRQIINAEKIKLMKNNAVFINTSRAELVDMDMLINRVDTVPQFMVGMDIDIDNYSHLLNKKRSNLLITPHTAGVSLDAIVRMDTEIAHAIINNTKR